MSYTHSDAELFAHDLAPRLNLGEAVALRSIYYAAEAWLKELDEYVIPGSEQFGDQESADAQRQEHEDLSDALTLFSTLAILPDKEFE